MRSIVAPRMIGTVSVFSIMRDGTIDLPSIKWFKNTTLYGACDVIAKATNGDMTINGMYFEFVNLANPGDPISYPVVGLDDGLSYYTALELSADTDIVRVPINVGPSYSASGSDYSYNEVTRYAQTYGTTGYWGRTFSTAQNSTVYGVALVAMLDASDITSDIVVARVYKGGADEAGSSIEILKENQVGAQWTTSYQI